MRGALLSLLFPTLLVTPQDEGVTRAIEAYAAPLEAAGLLSGRLLVARGDELLCERSFGLANHELGVPITASTRFCVASISKPMTIALATRLIEEEKLGVEDALERWLPGFPNGTRITISHLLNHRAGFAHRVTSAAEETVPRTAAWMAERARAGTPLFEPGERSQYSSTGYSVLARVCELAGESDYGTLLREKVLAPAGALESAHADARELLPGRAASYYALPGGFLNAPLKDLSFLVGAGSVWSTARDLHRLQRAVLDAKLGAVVPLALNASEGFAWNGITNGFRAFADYHRQDELHVIFTGNLHSGGVDLLRSAVPRLARGEELPPPAVPRVEVARVARAELARCEGLYRSRPGEDLPLRGAGTYATIGDWVLWPTSATTFFSPEDFATVTIRFDSEGRATGLEWVGPGFTLAWSRVGELPADS